MASPLVKENHDPNPLCEIASPCQRPRRISWPGSDDSEAPGSPGRHHTTTGNPGWQKGKPHRERVHRLEKDLRGMLTSHSEGLESSVLAVDCSWV